MKNYKFEDMKVGQTESFSIEISEEMIDMFQRISGDVNPLHANAVYAKKKGHKNRVVHGLLSSSFYSTLVGVYLPGQSCLLQGIETTFQKPVYPGDHLTITGEVSYVNEAYRQIEIKAQITNQDNVKVLKSKIKVGFHE
jgi:3-hydroxybutyryl-CoA dehydratase